MPVCNSRYAKLAGENRNIRRKYVLQRSLKEFIGESTKKELKRYCITLFRIFAE
jgi:hypothetical protein